MGESDSFIHHVGHVQPLNSPLGRYWWLECLPACLPVYNIRHIGLQGMEMIPSQFLWDGMIWLSLALFSGTKIAGGTNQYFGSDNDGRALKVSSFHIFSPHAVSTKLHVSLGRGDRSSTRSNNRGLCILSFARLPETATPGQAMRYFD